MYRLCLLALVLLCWGAPLAARAVDESTSPPRLEQLTAEIQAELQSHGERVLGRDVYRWSTRLEKVENCRAEFSVRVANKIGDAVMSTESVRFSLGALDRSKIAVQKSWLELHCAREEKCIFSTSTCSKTSKDGIAADCSSASQKQAESFAVELDGDAASALRLQKALREAIDLCHEGKPVTF
jgi:hypothetical protein